MNHFNLEDLQATINIRGVHAKTVVNQLHATIKNLILGPNEEIESHQVDVDVTFIILEGKGTITIGSTAYAVHKHDVVLCSPQTPMSIKADAHQGLNFLNIKTPGI